MPKTPAQPNQSLMHGLAVLQALLARGGAVGSRELARELEMEHTRVNRLLGTLGHLGVVRRTAEGKYGPGAGIHVLAAQALRGSGLLAAAMPHLAALRDRQTTVALGVLWRAQVCYLLHARPGRSLEESIGAHDLIPAERSSLGLALQAWGEERGPRGTDRSALRAAGYARLDFPNGEVSLAVPIGAPAVAALGLSRQSPDVPALVARLQAAAEAIADDLRKFDLTAKG
ncbi:MAG: hypothetical protein AMXMBFR7_27560 [Planctomycetota bacterium]